MEADNIPNRVQVRAICPKHQLSIPMVCDHTPVSRVKPWAEGVLTIQDEMLFLMASSTVILLANAAAPIPPIPVHGRYCKHRAHIRA